MPDSTDSTTSAASSDQDFRERPPTRPADKDKAQQVIYEIVRHAASDQPDNPGVTRLAIAQLFWWAHLCYAKANPGYLSDWPLVRTSWGADIEKGDDLLQE